MTEQWKKIDSLENYEVSNFGRVRSKARSILFRDGRVMKYDTKIIKHSYSRGYRIVCIRRKSFYIHHLVWDNFGEGNRDGHTMIVDHKDEVKENNHINNLQLLTHRDNITKSVIIRGKKLLPGVSMRRGKFGAWICVNYKSIFLGSFPTEAEAHQRYVSEKLKL